MASNIMTGGSFQSFPEAMTAIDDPNPKQTAIGTPKTKNAIPKYAKIMLADIFPLISSAYKFLYPLALLVNLSKINPMICNEVRANPIGRIIDM